MMIVPFLLMISLLNEAIFTIENLPSASSLLRKVEQEGGFSVKPIYSGDFDAYWDGNRREVLVNLSKHDSVSSVVFSILFELHNASSNQRIKQLQALAAEGRLSKKHFVRKVERMEWKNLNHALQLFEEGKEEGILPRHFQLPCMLNFADHLDLQVHGGHSAYIGEIYEDVLKFR